MLNITSGKIAREQKVVLYGLEGIGKTTLAAQFPDPLFIDTENGTSHLDVKRITPAPIDWKTLTGYVVEVSETPGICKTLVIDTADWAERLCVEYVLTRHRVSGIEDFGYGKGYTYVKEEFTRLLDALSTVVARGINVVVTAHSQIKKFEQPDEMGAYDRFELKLSRQASPLLKEWADMVLFLNYKTIIVQPDAKTGGHAKAQGGKRVMYTTHTPAWDAKNRFGLPEELPMEYASIAHCIPGTEPTDQAPQQADIASVAPEATPTDNKSALVELMQAAEITPEMLESYSAAQGHCPANTKFETYPEKYCNFLIANWDDIAKDIAVPFK